MVENHVAPIAHISKSGVRKNYNKINRLSMSLHFANQEQRTASAVANTESKPAAANYLQLPQIDVCGLMIENRI